MNKDNPEQQGDCPKIASLDRPLQFILRFPADIRKYIIDYGRYDVVIPDLKTCILSAILLICTYFLVEFVISLLSAAVWPVTWLIFFVFLVPSLQDGSVQKRIPNFTQKLDWLWILIKPWYFENK